MIIQSISEIKIPYLHFQGVGGEKGSKGEMVSPAICLTDIAGVVFKAVSKERVFVYFIFAKLFTECLKTKFQELNACCTAMCALSVIFPSSILIGFCCGVCDVLKTSTVCLERL